jgi:peptide/nickel transport system substrate-binding protein
MTRREASNPIFETSSPFPRSCDMDVLASSATTLGALRRALLLGLAACLIWLAAGCGDDDAGGAGVGGSAIEVDLSTPEAPGEIDRVVWANPDGEPTTLFPPIAPSPSEFLVIGNLCEPLFRLKDDGTVEPGLAQRLELVTPTEIAVHIRDDAEFWNGDPVTAEDVVYSLGRAADPKQSLVAFWTANVKSVRATGPRDVTITLKRPDSLYHRYLATQVAMIFQEEYTEAKGDEIGTPTGGLMCSGPYQLKSWTRGESIVIERHDGWWNKAERPKAREIEFRFVKDEATLTAALVAGEIDGTFQAPISGAAQLRSSSTGKLYVGETTLTQALMPLATDSALTDPKLREAIALSIDYQGIVKAVFKGYGRPAPNLAGPGATGIGRDAYKALWERQGEPKRDLERARQLVREAGAEGRVIRIPTSSDVEAVKAGVNTIADGLRRIGLKVEQESFSNEQYFPLLFDAKLREKFDFIFTAWNVDVGDPQTIYAWFAYPGGLVNTTGYDDPKVTRLLDEARAEYDDEARSDLVAQAAEQFAKTGPMITVAQRYDLLYMNNRITGVNPFWPLLFNPWAVQLGASGEG